MIVLYNTMQSTESNEQLTQADEESLDAQEEDIQVETKEEYSKLELD